VPRFLSEINNYIQPVVDKLFAGAEEQAAERLWTYDNDRHKMDISGITRERRGHTSLPMYRWWGRLRHLKEHV